MSSETLKPCEHCGTEFKSRGRTNLYCSRPCASSVRLHRRDLLKGLVEQARLDPSGCWTWTGNINESGYGRIRCAGKPTRAHRVSYRIFRGLIPEGLVVDHLCRNRACVNPQHLELVTQRENVLRGVGLSALNARKTHCKHGHPFSGDNLRVYVDAQGHKRRACIACQSRRNGVPVHLVEVEQAGEGGGA